jgi:hypothetical protein
MVTKQENIFMHYQAKLCVQKVENDLVENFAKKDKWFSSVVL